MNQPAQPIAADAAPTYPRLHRPEADGPAERRRHRRHELLEPQVVVERFDPATGQGQPLGEIGDISAGGVRVRTGDPTLKPGQTVAIRLRLPSHAGIAPFVTSAGASLKPTCEWTGHLAVLRRVERADGTIDLGGRLLGMDEAVRGMLGLYLSIQPLAA